MDTDMDANSMLVCPYDKSHDNISAVRMPYHLIKCRKNFPTTDLVVCPFNACHEIHKAELRYHMQHCPNRSLLEKDITYDVMLKAARNGKVSMLKGYTDLPKYKDDIFLDDDTEEDWDRELGHSTCLAFPRTDNRRFQPRENRKEDRDSDLRLPLTEGKAARLASLSTPKINEPASYPSQPVFDYGFLSRGRGRARQTLSDSTKPGAAPHLRPNIPSASLHFPYSSQNRPSSTSLSTLYMKTGMYGIPGRGRGILSSTTS